MIYRMMFGGEGILTKDNILGMAGKKALELTTGSFKNP